MGYLRKHVIKLFNGQRGCRKAAAGREKKYGSDIVDILRKLWIDMDYLCSKLLKEVLPEWVIYYEEANGVLSEEVRAKVLSVSAAQIDRVLRPFRVSSPKWQRRGPKPGSLIRSEVPIRTGPWDVSEPGHMEADTVAHCGDSLRGSFFWSVTLTDIHTQWTATRSAWNRGQHEVLSQIKDIEKTLPFELLALDVDNGGEFLNWHVAEYLKRDSKRCVKFTRSRPYKKNDQAHIEQKNWSHVRQVLGYGRLDNPDLKETLNRMWRKRDLYRNFFIPCMKLESKQRVGSKYRKKYDKGKTPYARVLESVSEARGEELRKFKSGLNPLKLKGEINRLLREISKRTSCPQPDRVGPTSNGAHSPAAIRLWTTLSRKTKVPSIMS